MNLVMEDFIGGGGGFVGETKVIDSSKIKIINDKEEWLKSGYVETDIASYPDAEINFDINKTIETMNNANNPATTYFHSIYISPDGLKMYAIDTTSDAVKYYELTTKNDLSTQVFVNSFSVSSQESAPHDLHFSPDGLNLYVTGTSGDDVSWYVLSTAWDVTTASFQTQSLFISGAGFGITASEDGYYFYVSKYSTLTRFTLSTAWDITTGIATDTMPFNGYYRIDLTSDGRYIIGNNNGSTTTVYVCKFTEPNGIVAESIESKAYTDLRIMCSFVSHDMTTYYYTIYAPPYTIYQRKILLGVGIPKQKIDTDTNLPIYKRIK